jgi:hypothetical protein
MRRIALLAAAALLACAAVPTAPYLHAPSGFALPARAGEFTRTQVFPSGLDLGADSETAHYERRGFEISRISLTLRRESAARGDPAGELAFATARLGDAKQSGPALPEAYTLFGATRRAVRAHLEYGPGSFVDHADAIVVPCDGWVIDARLYATEPHDPRMQNAFREILRQMERPAAPLRGAAPP